MADKRIVGPIPDAREGYKLVAAASEKLRRTGNKLARLKRQLAQASKDHDQAQRELRAAIMAVQPVLVEVEDQACCSLFDPLAENPSHTFGCRNNPQPELTTPS